MNKAEIEVLAQNICLSTADPATLSQFIDDVLTELSRTIPPPVVDSELVSLATASATYNLPSSAVNALHAIFKGIVLSPTEVIELEAYDKDWRTLTSSSPFAYTRDEQDSRTFMLFPIPASISGTLNPIDPYAPIADNHLCLIFSSNRTTDIPDYLALSVALKALTKEFEYPSNHRDLRFAQACLSVARIIDQIAGN